MLNGSVGIGTSSPRAVLEVNGAYVNSPVAVNTGATINFAIGNIQYTSLSCGAQTFNLNNLKDGGSYMFVVKGTTSGTCAFNGYSDNGVTLLTMHLPPDLTATVSGKHTVFNISVAGTDVYVAWTSGY